MTNKNRRDRTNDSVYSITPQRGEVITASYTGKRYELSLTEWDKPIARVRYFSLNGDIRITGDVRKLVKHRECIDSHRDMPELQRNIFSMILNCIENAQ